jgi:hypothetical protein
MRALTTCTAVEEHGPGQCVPELLAGLRIGRDPARVVIGSARDQAGAQDPEQPRLGRLVDRAGTGIDGVLDFEGHVRLSCSAAPIRMLLGGRLRFQYLNCGIGGADGRSQKVRILPIGSTTQPQNVPRTGPGHRFVSLSGENRRSLAAGPLDRMSVVNGNIFNSQGVHVGIVMGNEVYGLKGQKIYDLKGSNIYKLNGDLVGHLSDSRGAEKRLDKATDKLFPST